MKLLLMRHAEASFQAESDELRELTALGVEQAKAKVELVHEHAPELVLSSGLVRAVQTLQALELTDCKHRTSNLLTPEASVARAASMLESLDYNCVLVVAHMPLLGKLHGWLTQETPLGFSLAQVTAYDWSVQLAGEARQLF